MADDLGTARLVITVDDGPARKKLKELREEIEKGGTGVGSSRRSAANTAATKAERDLEVLKEKRFRLARRIDALEEKGVSTSRLRTQLGRLTTAYAERDFDLARKYARELARAATLEEQRTRSAARRRRLEERDFTRGPARRLDRTPLQGSVREIGSPRFVNNGIRQGGASESIDALFQAQKRRYNLDQQIRSLENAGLNTDRLRAQLGRVTEAQAQRRFGTAKQLGEQLSFQLRKERDILNTRLGAERAATRQTRAAEAEGRRIGRLNTSPVMGGTAFPGSPAFIQAAADRRRQVEKSWDLALRQLGETAETIRQNAIDEGRRIGRLNAVPVSGVTPTGLIPGSPAAINAAAAQRRRDLKEGRRVGQLNASPVRGGAAFPGSPAFLDAQFPAFPAEFFRKQKQDQVKQQRLLDQGIKRRNDILSNALIGGAFPALFGQGLGASLGGAAGGAAGGAIGGQFGFGLSLVGTALGAQVDVAIQKFRDLAKALDDPIKNFDLLVQNASLSSKQVEKYAQALIKSGRNAEAAAFIQSDLIETFGSLQGAKEYNNAIDTLSRSWSKATTVLAGFVAGPLAALIRQIEQPTSGGAIGLSFEQLAGQLTPEQYRQVQSRREQATESSRLSRGGISAFLPPSNEDVNRGLQAGVQLAQELLGIEKQRADLAARIAYAQVLSQKALSTSYELITASAQGYQLQALEKQKEVALNERNIKLLELTPEQRKGPQGLKIQQDAALSVYEIDVKINDLRKDRIALATEEAAKYELAAQKVRQEIQAVQALASLSQNAQRTAQFAVQQSTLGTIQGIEAAVGDARRREQEIGAQIDAARIRGGDAGEQDAARLVGEQKIAANQTRLQLEQGARALTEAGIKLREDVQTAFLNLQKLRTGSGGLNQFLNPQDRANQEQRTFEALLPSFRQAQEQFKRLRGVEAAPEFTGTTSGVNQSILQFIDAVRTEQQALDTSVDTQRALNDNTAALAQVTGELRTTIAELNTKNWAVQVNVAADGSSQAFGDVLAGAVSP